MVESIFEVVKQAYCRETWPRTFALLKNKLKKPYTFKSAIVMLHNYNIADRKRSKNQAGAWQ
jgi:hypothetical protein